MKTKYFVCKLVRLFGQKCSKMYLKLAPLNLSIVDILGQIITCIYGVGVRRKTALMVVASSEVAMILFSSRYISFNSVGYPSTPHRFILCSS